MNNTTKCSNCGSSALVQLSSDVTCTECGVEQNLGNFISEVNAYDRVSRDSRQIKYDENIISFVNYKLNIDESDEACEICSSLYMDYTADKIIKTDKHKTAVYAACVYLGLANYTKLSGRNVQHICTHVGVEMKCISKYIKDVVNTTSSKDRWIGIDDMCSKNRSINKAQLNDICKYISREKKKDFIKYSCTVFDNLKKLEILQSCKENSIYSAIFYLVNKKMSTNIKLKIISCICSTTDATTLSIVRRIDNIQGLFQ